jgi:hypothetical protein
MSSVLNVSTNADLQWVFSDLLGALSYTRVFWATKFRNNGVATKLELLLNTLDVKGDYYPFIPRLAGCFRMV